MIKKLLFVSMLLIILSISANAVNYDFVVAKDGSGGFTSLQKAIDACKAFPDKRVTIFIKNGTYKEKIVVPSCNSHLSIIGESADKTIITFDDYFSKINRGRNSTFYTYTLKVEANDFILENITVENSAGPVGQALALDVEGDRCVFRNCRFLGNQDTVYTAGRFSRQYFDGCYIEGTTDYNPKMKKQLCLQSTTTRVEVRPQPAVYPGHTSLQTTKQPDTPKSIFLLL